MKLTVADHLWPFLAGIGLGLGYLLALWWTVKRLPKVQRPMLLTVASFYLRMLVLIAGFYLVMAGRFDRMAACLLGFFAARLVMLRRMRQVSCERVLSKEG